MRPGSRALLLLAAAACAAAVSLDAAAGTPAAGAAPAPGPRGDVRRGSAVFIAKSCARCHSIWGHGGEIGPDLGRTRAGALTDSELAAAMWNHVPRMWGKMQEERIPHVAIAEAEMADLFAYLSFVRALDEPGDPDTGRLLLGQKRCGTCHALEDREGRTAPDLRRWARHRNPAVWAKLMFDHAPRMIEEMRRRGIPPPSLDARELVHVVSYIRSLSATDEAELLDPGDGVAGERIFRERRCGECHAVRGKGGRVGPDLGRRGWVTSFTGVAIAQWRHAAGMRTAMAERGIRAPTLTSQEMAHVVVYLFSAAYADDPGSPRRGAEVFEAKGCASCHTTGVGPALEQYRGRATPVTLACDLWKHGPAMLERMRERGVRWPSFGGDEMRHLIAFLNAPAPGRPVEESRASPGGETQAVGVREGGRPR
jgi:cytochrome c2